MSKSIVYIFALLFFFTGEICFGQGKPEKDPSRSDAPLTEAEINQLLQDYQPQVGRSYLQMPDDFKNPETQRSLLDSRGTEFWLMFMNNLGGANARFLDLTCGENATGTISIPGIGFSTNFSITANTVTRVNIPLAAEVITAGVVQNRGIKVTSDKEISVYGISGNTFSTDGYLGLPIDILGNQYLVMTYPILTWGGFFPDQNWAPQFAIVSPYDNNVVTITPRDLTVSGNPAGVPFSVTLNQGQTYLVRGRLNNSFSADQTGSVVSSTLPVAVFSGSSCASVPQNFAACDHLISHIPPISTWGKTFVTRPLQTRLNGDTWRFLSSQNGTQLFLNGSLAATLNFGDFYETILTVPTFVEASNPILTVQFSNSSSFDGVVSDPFMMIIPPFQQYLDSYTFATPVEGFTGHYFTSAVASDGVDGMELNGAPLNSASYAAIGSTGFSAAAFPISTNTSYNLNNTEGYPSGLYVYGFGEFNSYGFPGGLSLLSINPGSGPTIELTSTVVGELFCTSVSQSVDIEITALITDPDEPFVQFATLFYRTLGEMNYTSVPMTQGAGDEWSAVVLATATQFPGLEFYIFATDGQIAVTSPSVDPVNNPYVIAIENMPPQIVHVPLVNSQVGEDILVSADVTDNTVSVAGVDLYYRIAGGTPLYTMLNMGNSGGDSYQATIPGSQMTLQGIEYYIKATDNFGASCFFGLPDMPLFIASGVAENIPPVPVGFPAVAPSIFVGDTYSLTVQFQSPEAGQTTDVVVNDGGLVGFSAVVTSGNVASVDIELVGQVGNLGTHTIEFIATDNGSPSLSTTVQFQISVLDPIAGHVICIPQGWSGISSYNDPFNPAMEDIFASLVAENKVTIVLGDNGFYWPAQNINTLTSGWDVKKGYKIKMNEPGCLGIVGDMPADKSFTAKKGASFIPVLCDQPVPAVDVFSQFGNDLLFAFDIYAQLVYWPQGGLYTLETLEPGVGYLVNMLNQGQASYSCSRSTVANFVKAHPTVYADAPWSYAKTGTMHFISINQSALSELSKGDYIGVFNAEGVCAGFAQFTGEDGNMLLMVNGDDVTTQNLDGMLENQEMTFKIYRSAGHVELPLEVTFDASMPNNGSFSELGQSRITKMSVVLTSVFESKLDKIYLHPNPGNGIFNLEIPADDQPLQIQVMNVSGQVIYSSSIDSRTNSSYRLDLSNHAQGVYFVKITDLNETVVKKVVIQ